MSGPGAAPRSRRLGRLAAPWVAAAWMAGCAGSLLQTHLAPTTAYRLACGVEPATAPAVVDADLTLLRPRVRAGLASDRIAVLFADGRFDHYAAAAWSGPLDTVLEDLALEAFRRRGVVRSVDAGVAPIPARYWLEIRVLDFQAEYAGGGPPAAHVRLVGMVGETGRGRLLATFEADARHAAAADRLADVVAAFDAAANDALRGIVDDTAAALRR